MEPFATIEDLSTLWRELKLGRNQESRGAFKSRF